MKFWEISDSFWEAVKPLIPETVRDPEKVYQPDELPSCSTPRRVRYI